MEPMPTPRPRARVIAMAGRKPMAVFYSPQEYKAWQADAKKHLSKVSWWPQGPIEGPLYVAIKVVAERPKSTKLLAPKPDVDNYAKGVLDAITDAERFWKDDTQVTDLLVQKRWSSEGEPAGIFVHIIPLDPKDL